MDILIIGGTQFVGRALSEAVLANGHNLTLFHRGKTNSDLFPEAEHILGDRDGDLEKLGDQKWDTVIDTCGYVPRLVKDAAEYLADKVEQYVFISTISVFAESAQHHRDENAELAQFPESVDPNAEEITGETYGPLKVACEQIAEEIMPKRVLTIRPGLIVGPHDHTGRFTYWPVRVRDGGDILAPGTSDLPTQMIDVRDLAEWTVRMVEAKQMGIYNATGPATTLTVGEMLQTCHEVSGSDGNFVWVEDQFLMENEVAPTRDLPQWVPAEMSSIFTISVQKAVDAGLTFRPLADTVRDTLAWVDGDESRLKTTGLTPEREQELLAAYRAQ